LLDRVFFLDSATDIPYTGALIQPTGLPLASRDLIVRFTLASFNQPDRERQYRQESLPQNRKQLMLSISLVAGTVVAFGLVDLVGSGGNSHTLYIRLAVLVLTAMVGWRVARCRSPRALDTLGLLWMLLVGIELILLSVLRPADTITIPVVNILAIFMAYVLVPVPLRLQIAAALTFSAGFIALGVGAHGWRPEILLAYAMANVLGSLMSRRQNRVQRLNYAWMRRERSARERLTRALAEVKVLKGILPICSCCKKVRNEEGDYIPVDSYVSHHTGAVFSHTFCPECMEERYPDFQGG